MGWTPLDGIECANMVVLTATTEETSEMNVSMMGLDLAKNVFQLQGADTAAAVVFRKQLRRDKLLAFFAGQPACIVAMEACSSAHYWPLSRLIAPAYVKPFVKRQKNDASDAEAICEAAQRPTMRFVTVKSEEQQASAAVFRARDKLVRNVPRRSTPCGATWRNMD